MTEKRTCLQRLFLFFCTLVCAAAFSVPAAFAQDARSAIEEKGNNTRYITVPGRGETLFYAQRNPMFNRMIYEYRGSRTARIFGDGGCGPSATAAALMALLDPQDLTVLQQYTMNGEPFSVCQHTMNAWSCARCKERLQITAPEDYVTYLPVILASYACGNNPDKEVWRRKSASLGGSGGTGMQFLYSVCPHLSLSCVSPEDNSDASWLDQVGENTVAVGMSASSPFTGSGHYVAVLWVDDEYIYMFDPMQPSSYSKKHDKLRIIEVIEPGLVKVRRDEYRHLGFYTIYIISKDAQPAPDVQQ